MMYLSYWISGLTTNVKDQMKHLAEHCGRPRLQRPQDQLLHVQAHGTQRRVEVADVESSEVMMTKLFFCPLQFDF